jgi:hypothetical protein
MSICLLKTENTRKLQGEISGLKKDIAVLKDSTLVGEKQRELDRERSENHDNIGRWISSVFPSLIALHMYLLIFTVSGTL